MFLLKVILKMQLKWQSNCLSFSQNVAVSKFFKLHPNICGQISLTGAGIPFQPNIFAAKTFCKSQPQTILLGAKSAWPPFRLKYISSQIYLVVLLVSRILIFGTEQKS